jgi:hypothetical protein
MVHVTLCATQAAVKIECAGCGYQFAKRIVDAVRGS